jgi:hypothetical protein
MPENDVRLVCAGFTVSNPTAAFGRIGEEYVMRDNYGHRIVLSVDTQTDHIREIWGAFRDAATGDLPMPPTLFGETVEASRDPEPQPNA